jgi:hypothetical protein
MLNPRGFLHLAGTKVLHPGVLDNRSIVDRSKADSLAKLLVCAQAFWMVLNVIARKLDGLPNTLIELNVVVHVVVMVVVYGLWWDKPLGVMTPIILNLSTNSYNGQIPEIEPKSVSTSRDNLAELHRQILLLHHSDGPMKYVHSYTIWDSGDIKSWILNLLGYTVQIPENLGLTFEIFEICTAENISTRKERERQIRIANLHLDSERHSEGLLLLPGQLLVWKGLGDYKGLYFGSHCRSKTNPYFITKSYMLQLRNMYFHDATDQETRRTGALHGSSCRSAISDPTNMVVDGGISNWSKNGGRNWLLIPAPILTIGATILSILYAGCHATAWSAYFPTFTERYFWRGACIVIASGGPFAYILYLLHLNMKRKFSLSGLFGYTRDLADKKIIPRWLYTWCILPLCAGIFIVWCLVVGAGALLYVLARIFIVIESFISMRNLPVGAYDSINWIQILPHM